MNKSFIQIGLLVILTIVIMSGSAFAQLPRNFPADSKFGELSEIKYPLVVIDDEEYHMGTGGQMRGTNNLIILPAQFDYTGPVQYQLDTMGYVYRIWFLSEDEATMAEERADKSTMDKFLDFFDF